MFNSLNSTGGHIFVCLLIVGLGAVMTWVGRNNPVILSVGVGLIQTGVGVAFRSMGVSNSNSNVLPTAQKQ